MAEVDSAKVPSLVEDYFLEGKDKAAITTTKTMVEADAKTPANVVAEDIVPDKTEDTSVLVPPSEVPAATSKENTEASDSAVGESTESAPASEPTTQVEEVASEEASESAESDSSAAADGTPEIKLETAPADFRFPTTNQSRHCFTRYIEYHRCIGAKGDDAPECQKFAKYYRSLCPGEWIERWNEQRENGTFPGPL